MGADERFYPGTSRITEIESFHRYHAAASLCVGCSVLDAASGEGYGSNILAEKAAKVTGLDLCSEAVDNANEKYGSSKLAYVNDSALQMPFADKSFDRVVSFETIEHLPDHRKFLSEIRRVLKDDGILILSSPNKTPFRQRNQGENEYHITELEADELQTLLKDFFPELRFYNQDAFYNSVITADGVPFFYVQNQQKQVVKHVNLVQAQYSLVLASARKLPELASSFYLDAAWDSKRGYVIDDEAVVNQFGLRGEFEKKYAECENQRSMLAEKEQALNKESAKSDYLYERCSDLDEKLISESAKSEYLFDKCNTLEKNLAGEVEKNLSLSREHAELEKKLAVETEKNSQLFNAKSEAEEKFAREVEKSEYLFQERAELEKKLSAEEEKSLYLFNERSELNKKLDAAEEKNQICAIEKSGLEQKLAAEKEKVSQISAAKSETEAKLVLAEEKNQLIAAEKGELQQKLAAETARKEALISECAAVEKRLQSSMEKYAALNKELGELENAFKQLNNAKNALESDLQSMEKKNRDLENICTDLKALIAQKSAEYQDLTGEYRALNDKFNIEQTKNQQLAEEKAVLENKLQELNGQLQQLQERCAELERQYREECAKSEYLWIMYNDVKSSWSFRLFGRWGLRRKIKNFFCGFGKVFHTIGKKIFLCLPFNYRYKMQLKDSLYRHFGGIFRDVRGYRDWQLRQNSAAIMANETDTGLIVPKDVPLTSIIIPVYNNIEFTRRCLYSICKCQSKSPFEIIIVDDCSSKDDYQTLLKDFPQIKLVRNEKNSGFLLTANKGAANATGEYILFLNNDTEVLPGWLDELTTALYHHPEAGMIGSQLIHISTGTMQESGNLICKNGDMMPLGRGVEPDHPQYTFFREVDFCSAASIILRKKVFDEMNGFDTIFVPAYFEDPDLGLRMQKAGYKNYVCPLSKVLHQEMASYGDTFDEKCEKNRQTFLNRWSEYLQEHSLYESREEGNSSFKWEKERILYIDAEVPMADRGSGGMDAIFFMEYMIKRGYHVCFHGEYTAGYVPKYTTILLRMGVECIYLPQRKIWEYLESSGWTFSHIFVSRIYQARCFDRLLKKYAPQATYIFDTVDVHFVREKLEADLRNDPELHKLAEKTKEYELAVAKAADATIVISSDEKKLLEEQYNLTNVVHIPQARQLFGLAPNQNRRGSVFIGSAHPPNMDGLRYFHDEILPLLPKDFELTIIGEALRDMIGKTPEYKDLLKCPQFKFVGFVADLGDVLNYAKMTVAPLRYGAGTKGKVASSMSYGIPCVSSAFGTEGTGMMHGENIMIAKNAEEFAKYIMELESDQELWKKISDGGIKFIRDNYAPETVEKMMDDLFDMVKANKAAGKSNWAQSKVVPKVDDPVEE